MACYHFRIKTDKKPNGFRISSTDHVAYMDRDGKYRNIENKQELGDHRSYKNLIAGDSPILALPEKPMLLYSSPFGKIQMDKTGIRVSHHASIETVAIALATAQKIFGDEVRIDGSEMFSAQAVHIANEFALGVHFKNIELEIARARDEKERESNGFDEGLAEGYAGSLRRRTHSAGGRGRNGKDGGTARSGRNEKRHFINATELISLPVNDIAERTKESLAPTFRLHVLPASNVARKRGRPRLLLPRDVGAKLLNERSRQHPNLNVRRSISRKRADAINAAADSILKILQKNETGDFAFSHLQYINREGLYTSRGGCTMTGDHLPAWANDSAHTFFHAADRFERANGERYKEIVFSLPNELPIEKSKEILDRFLEKHLKNHYYHWAIHEKIGSLSLGERHPHVHIMFSTREIDAEERRQERSPKLFFSRANKKHPEKGGCPKAEKWRGCSRADYLFQMREDYAVIQNEILEKYGVPSRVDFLSLEVQKMNAEQRGDFALADMLDRVPETHVHPISILRDDDIVRQQKQLRAFNEKKVNGVLQRELDFDAKKEKQTHEKCKRAESLAESLLEEDISDLNENAQENLQRMRGALREQMKDVRISEANVIWGQAALEEAKLEWLGEDGREAWDDVMHLRKSLHEQKLFWMECYRPENPTEDEDIAHEEIEEAISDRIKVLEAEYKAAAKKLQPHLKKLSSRSVKKHLPYRVNQLLFENKLPKQRYIHSVDDLEKKARAYKRALDNARARHACGSQIDEMRNDVTMTLDEAKRLLFAARYYQDQSIKRKTAELREAQKKVYSYARMISMAENVFEHGGVKRLREEEKRFQKAAESFERDLEDFTERKEAFKARHEAYTPAYHSEKAMLLKELEKLNERRARLYQWKTRNEKTRAAIERRRDTPEAEEKVQRIAAGIYKKNRPAVERVKKIAAELKAMQQEYDSLKKQGDVVAVVMDARGNERHVVPSHHGGGGGSAMPSRIDDARGIADTLQMQHGALIAREEKDRTLQENWNLVSEMEKDEIEEEMSHGR